MPYNTVQPESASGNKTEWSVVVKGLLKLPERERFHQWLNHIEVKSGQLEKMIVKHIYKRSDYVVVKYFITQSEKFSNFCSQDFEDSFLGHLQTEANRSRYILTHKYPVKDRCIPKKYKPKIGEVFRGNNQRHSVFVGNGFETPEEFSEYTSTVNFFDSCQRMNEMEKTILEKAEVERKIKELNAIGCQVNLSMYAVEEHDQTYQGGWHQDTGASRDSKKQCAAGNSESKASETHTTPCNKVRKCRNAGYPCLKTDSKSAGDFWNVTPMSPDSPSFSSRNECYESPESNIRQKWERMVIQQESPPRPVARQNLDFKVLWQIEEKQKDEECLRGVLAANLEVFVDCGPSNFDFPSPNLHSECVSHKNAGRYFAQGNTKGISETEDLMLTASGVNIGTQSNENHDHQSYAENRTLDNFIGPDDTHAEWVEKNELEDYNQACQQKNGLAKTTDDTEFVLPGRESALDCSIAPNEAWAQTVNAEESLHDRLTWQNDARENIMHFEESTLQSLMAQDQACAQTMNAEESVQNCLTRQNDARENMMHFEALMPQDQACAQTMNAEKSLQDCLTRQNDARENMMHFHESNLQFVMVQDQAYVNTMHVQGSVLKCLDAKDKTCPKTVDNNESVVDTESKGNHRYENKINLLGKRPLTPVFSMDTKKQRSVTARTLQTFRMGMRKC